MTDFSGKGLQVICDVSFSLLEDLFVIVSRKRECKATAKNLAIECYEGRISPLSLNVYAANARISRISGQVENMG
jgi:hypothetical protein